MMTTPNLLTASRIVVIPIFVAAFYLAEAAAAWTTFALFAAAAITDYFDGHLARARSQQSPLGRMMDPIADKLLVATALLMLVHVEAAPIVPVLVILCREFLVSGLREFLVETGASLPVSKLAKWKTGVQMVAIGFLLLGDVAPFGLPTALMGTLGLWLAAVLTAITGADYLRVAFRHATMADAGTPPGDETSADPNDRSAPKDEAARAARAGSGS